MRRWVWNFYTIFFYFLGEHIYLVPSLIIGDYGMRAKSSFLAFSAYRYVFWGLLLFSKGPLVQSFFTFFHSKSLIPLN